MFNWIRNKVSLNKRRYVEGNYDLDLSYVGDRIIAMGYPSSGLESLYRNDFTDVRHFLDERHGDKYWVYNLCSERSYEPISFDNRVSCFPFDDHNPPKFDLIRRFCVEAANWLENDPENIVVIHCKAGKGRTGVMICSLLIHMRTFSRASESLQFYGQRRTFDEKGVTIPSQRRYVFYYEQFLADGHSTDIPLELNPCRIVKIRFENIPSKYFTRSLGIKIINMPGQEELRIETFGNGGIPLKDHSKKSLEYDLRGIMPFYIGDFRISAIKGGKSIWYMWFNSHFVLPFEEFYKTDIDKIVKDSSFPNDFKMIVYSER